MCYKSNRSYSAIWRRKVASENKNAVLQGNNKDDRRGREEFKTGTYQGEIT